MTGRAVLFQSIVIEKEFLHESSKSEFSHSLGHSRRFDLLPVTSDLPLSTDIFRSARLVRFVPTADVDADPTDRQLRATSGSSNLYMRFGNSTAT